jgi:hypothetical protein
MPGRSESASVVTGASGKADALDAVVVLDAPGTGTSLGAVDASDTTVAEAVSTGVAVRPFWVLNSGSFAYFE